MSSTDREDLDGEPVKLLENEIRDLEEQLARAKLRLNATSHDDGQNGVHQPIMPKPSSSKWQVLLPFFYLKKHTKKQPIPFIANHRQAFLQNTTTHFLLLLADSALPLGSFAFSSGLESYLAHVRLNPFAPATPSFDLFLPLSVASYASTTLPFLLAAHRDPSRLAELDDALDAAVVCTVGKRASVAQGRALLGIWERSFASPSSPPASRSSSSSSPALDSLAEHARLLRTPAGRWDAAGLPPVAAHLAPLFGVVASVFGLALRQAAYVFVLGHVKALVSAAVRANVFGPYAAQRILASSATQETIQSAIDREWSTPPEEAGQAVPAMDLWVGRHELLYSRIFNS